MGSLEARQPRCWRRSTWRWRRGSARPMRHAFRSISQGARMRCSAASSARCGRLRGMAIASFLLAALVAAPTQTTVILVRHAEKAAEPKEDPVLSDAGMTRAKALALALRDAGVQAILTTSKQRTRSTVQPLA